MNSEQIDKALRSDNMVKEVYVGTFPVDLLPNPKEFPGAYIGNTQPSTMSGNTGWRFVVTAMRWSVSTATGKTQQTTLTTY